MLKVLYNTDCIGADEEGYIYKILMKFGVLIVIKELYGPGGGSPMVTLFGDEKNIIKWLKHPTLGYGISDEELEEWLPKPYNQKKVGISKKKIIKHLFSLK